VIGWLLIFVGGGLGALLRGGLSALIQWNLDGRFPWGILAVNLIGCMAIGGVMPIDGARASLDVRWQFFAVTGFLGGFTTFSTFGLDTWRMLAHGDLALGVAYVVASVLGGIVAVALGAWVANAI